MKAVFNARRHAVWHYRVAIPGILLILAAIWYPILLPLGVAGLLFFGFSLYFFRDPNRAIPAVANGVVSPADGLVVGDEILESSPHYDGPCKRISIFLNIFNVHINRSPFDGTVESITYKPGEFRNAMRAETSDFNESNTIRMSTVSGPMTVRQISGLVARRIVCEVEVGETLAKGEKFGMIKFGSRTELYLPVTAEVCVRINDKVYGGSSIVARFPDKERCH